MSGGTGGCSLDATLHEPPVERQDIDPLAKSAPRHRTVDARAEALVPESAPPPPPPAADGSQGVQISSEVCPTFTAWGRLGGRDSVRAVGFAGSRRVDAEATRVVEAADGVDAICCRVLSMRRARAASKTRRRPPTSSRSRDRGDLSVRTAVVLARAPGKICLWRRPRATAAAGRKSSCPRRVTAAIALRDSIATGASVVLRLRVPRHATELGSRSWRAAHAI